jgi:hypothetical protein
MGNMEGLDLSKEDAVVEQEPSKEGEFVAEIEKLEVNYKALKEEQPEDQEEGLNDRIARAIISYFKKIDANSFAEKHMRLIMSALVSSIAGTATMLGHELGKNYATTSAEAGLHFLEGAAVSAVILELITLGSKIAKNINNQRELEEKEEKERRKQERAEKKRNKKAIEI